MSADRLANIIEEMIQSEISDYMQGYDFSNCWEFASAVESEVETQIDRMDFPDESTIMESCGDLMKDPYYLGEAMKKTAEFLENRIEVIKMSAAQSRDINRLQREVESLKKQLESRNGPSFALDA